MIEKSVVLPCGPEAAFDLFVDDIDHWWPRSRRHTDDAASRVGLDATSGLYEATSDGRTIPLGQVLEWARPERIVLDFYPGTDAEHPTRVRVTFSPEGADTRVTLEHRPTDASRDLWDSRAGRYVASWDLLLAELLRLAQSRAPGA